MCWVDGWERRCRKTWRLKYENSNSIRFIFGNTEKIARTIENTLKAKHDTKIKKAKNASMFDVHNNDLIIIGSPTRIFEPTKAIRKFVKKIDFKNKLAKFRRRVVYGKLKQEKVFNLSTRKILRNNKRYIRSVLPNGS